jgi:hypothetical protein
MEPNDPKLSELLKEWQVSNAPASLDGRVLDRRKRRLSFLLTGSIRVPVPAIVAIAAVLLVMTATLLRQRAEVVVPPPADLAVSLVDFRPVQDLNVRVIPRHETN